MIEHLTTRLDDCVEALQKLGGEGDSPAVRRMKMMGKNMAIFGAGSAAGLGLGVGMNALHQKLTGQPIPRAVVQTALPLLGAAAGMAYSTYKAIESESMNHVPETAHDARSRGTVGQ